MKKKKSKHENWAMWIVGLIFVMYVGAKYGFVIGIFCALVLGSLFKIVENTQGLKKK